MRKRLTFPCPSVARPAITNLLAVFLLAALASCCTVGAQSLEPKPADSYFAPFAPVEAPKPQKHFLKEGDRLAICGDSITEQRMYSRIMETYLTVCQPELNVSVRQYGWSGEKASGFLHRMTNDCLRFEPTVATTCYGMNDHEYRAYEDRIGNTYRSNSLAVVESFKAHGVRVILGSPGCVGKTPTWVGDKNASVLDLNLNLCRLRNIDIELAQTEKVGFADVFWPMLTEGHAAQERYDASYAIAGKDGVHPGWAGHVVMAYAFLHAFGLDGQIGTLTVDLRSKSAKVSKGHDLLGFDGSELRVTSHRYPFCAGNGDPSHDDNMRSGMALVPFDEELNLFVLVVKHANAKSYAVTWGDQTRNFSGEELTKGINLAREFHENPFCEAFGKVDEAVKRKQEFETKQVKEMFHGPAGKADMDGTVAKTEEQRAPLVAAIKSAFVPVTHTIKIVAQ
jgi:hypothetical protein